VIKIKKTLLHRIDLVYSCLHYRKLLLQWSRVVLKLQYTSQYDIVRSQNIDIGSLKLKTVAKRVVNTWTNLLRVVTCYHRESLLLNCVNHGRSSQWLASDALLPVLTGLPSQIMVLNHSHCRISVYGILILIWILLATQLVAQVTSLPQRHLASALRLPSQLTIPTIATTGIQSHPLPKSISKIILF
jgi:hypothetical protein